MENGNGDGSLQNCLLAWSNNKCTVIAGMEPIKGKLIFDEVL